MRVIIADDEVLLRRGLETVLVEGGVDVVAAVGDAASLLAAARVERPELVITDIRMPPSHTDEGLSAALELRREHPGLPVCVLSQHVLREPARALVDSGRGGVGYLLKQRIADIDRFHDDLSRVVAGEIVLDPEVAEQLVKRVDPIGTLTPRQREVLVLVARGRSNASIAAELGVSEKAVVQHVSRVYLALGLPDDPDAHRRVQAVVHLLTERPGLAT